MPDLQGGGSVTGKTPSDKHFSRVHKNLKPTGYVGALGSIRVAVWHSGE